MFELYIATAFCMIFLGVFVMLSADLLFRSFALFVTGYYVVLTGAATIGFLVLFRVATMQL